MNLFDNIINKAKTSGKYLATGQAWSDLYDWANPEQKDPIQRFFDDPAQDMSKKQALMDNLKSGVPTDVMKSYVTEKYYKPTEFKQVLPTVDPTFKSTGQENIATMWAKFLWNIPSNLYNFGAGTVNLASTAYQEGIPETAGMVGRGIVKWVGEWAEKVSRTYREEGLLPAINKTAVGLTKYAVENPLDVLSPSLVKPIGNALKTGTVQTGKAIVRGAEVVAPKVVQGIKKITPTIPKAEELLVNQLEKTNRMNPTKYTEFQQLSGERAGKFMADRKITGDAESNVAKLYDNFTKSKAEADTWLDAIQKTYKTTELPSSMQDMMSELQKRFAYTKDTGALKTVNDAMAKAENGTLSHSDINAIKRLYEQKVKVNYIKDQNSLEVERATNIDNDVRNWQFDEASKLGFDNLKLINKETQLNRYLADNIGEKIARQLGNNNISLTDWIIAGQVPATPQALALLAGKKFAEKAIPKLYQKWLEKIAKLPTKEAPVANIKNISKMEAIRKSVNPQYDTNRLLVSPRNSSRTPTTITPEVTLPTGEKWKQTIKSPNIKSDITSKSIIKRPTNESKVIKPKPKSVSVDTNNKQQVSNLEKEYVTKMKKWKNLVIDSDKIKEQFSDYDPKNPTTVHEKSSELSKIYYKNALKDPSYNKVVLTAWGGGSGKSEILVSGIPQNSGTLIFDWTGKNFKKIVSQYDEAKNAWKDAEIKAVYIDYNKAKQFNAKRERTVAEDILADTHSGYRKTLLQIAKERPDINISLRINTWIRDWNWNAISIPITKKNIVSFLEAHQELER
jgi:hypothetical protein